MFNPFDQFTVVIESPVGVEVRQARYAELAAMTVPDVGVGDGTTVEVIPPVRDGGRVGVFLAPGDTVKGVVDALARPVVPHDPLTDHPQREETLDLGDSSFAENVVTPDVVARNTRGPRAQTGAPIGPDPKQEAAKSVPVKAEPKGKKA